MQGSDQRPSAATCSEPTMASAAPRRGVCREWTKAAPTGKSQGTRAASAAAPRAGSSSPSSTRPSLSPAGAMPYRESRDAGVLDTPAPSQRKPLVIRAMARS